MLKPCACQIAATEDSAVLPLVSAAWRREQGAAFIIMNAGIGRRLMKAYSYSKTRLNSYQVNG
jgi:hypothetical protein